MKRDLLIACLGDAIIGKLYELDDNFGYEADVEFGGFEAYCSAYCFEFEWVNGRCDAEATVTWPYNKEPSVEVLVYGKKGLGGEDKDLSNIEKAVQDYVSRELDCQHLLDAMIEKLRVCYEDEYQRNGFASEADYLSWRYG